jgi:hypothetical protein
MVTPQIKGHPKIIKEVQIIAICLNNIHNRLKQQHQTRLYSLREGERDEHNYNN